MVSGGDSVGDRSMSRLQRRGGAIIPIVATKHTPTTGDPTATVSHGGEEHGYTGIVFASAAVAVVAVAAMIRWDDWFVNFDGEMYLALATNLKRGAGLVFPDGSFAAFRGPMYPAIIAGAWVFAADTARIAIWASRMILVANAVLLTLIAWRLSSRWAVALVAGVLVAVQPLVLRSGALFFVPDGAMAMFVLAAVLVFVWDQCSTMHAARLTTVGVLIGMAFLTKQTGGLGMLIIVGVLLVAPDGSLKKALRALPPLGFGFVGPVALWIIYTIIETGQASDGLPGFAKIGGGLGLVVIVALLAGLGVATKRLPEDANDFSIPRSVAVVGAFAVALVGLMALGAAAAVSVMHLWGSLIDALMTRLYGNTPWGLLLVPLAVAVGWGAMRLARREALVAGLITAVGIAGIVYAAFTGAGFRNGVLVIYGLSALLAFAVGDLWGTVQGRPWWRSVAVVSVGFAVVASVIAADVTSHRLSGKELTAESPAVLDASEWLSTLNEGTIAAGTPLYLSTLWRLAGTQPTLGLVPLHVIGRAEWEAGVRDLPNRVDWAGTVFDPAPLADPIGISSSRIQLSSFIGPMWEDYLEETRPAYLIVTGNARYSGSAFDGGLVLPSLEATPAARAVYRTDEALLPQWVVIYQLSYPFVVPSVPAVVHLVGGPSLDPLTTDAVALTSVEYHDMVIDILRRPLG